MRIKWLVEIIIRAFFERQSTLRRLSDLREQNGRRPDVGLAETTERLASIHTRHEDIQDDQFGMMGLRLFQGVYTIRDYQHMETCTFQEGRQAVGDGGVVVGEEDSRSIVGHIDFVKTLQLRAERTPTLCSARKIKAEQSLITQEEANTLKGGPKKSLGQSMLSEHNMDARFETKI